MNIQQAKYRRQPEPISADHLPDQPYPFANILRHGRNRPRAWFAWLAALTLILALAAAIYEAF